jgi:outer membrane receptor protein involved in Fe transport
MKKITTLLFVIISITASAQQGRGPNMNMGRFYGKIVDNNNRPVEAASVQLLQSRMDTATKTRKDIVVSGMLTDKKGEFSLENLPAMGSFKLRISAIGYKEFEQKTSFELKQGGDMNQMLNAVDKDLGNIKIEPDAKQLQEVVVNATAGILQMGIDRKVFNVDKNITSQGGTAVDVMKNVPSVNVDIDGNVTLRNAAPQIFVDGRPTTMTLEQIPADAIASVELITNPSAKFDASGGGSGILNIVLKKARRTGYSGNLRANLDSRAKFGIGGDVNMKQGKFNVFANTMYNQRKSKGFSETDRTDFLRNGYAFLQQKNAPINEGHFAFARAGVDFFLDNRNTFTIAGSHGGGNFNADDRINITRDTVLPNYTSMERGLRITDGRSEFRNYGSMFSYKHNFPTSGKELTADANFNYSRHNNWNNFQTQYFQPNNTPKTPNLLEQVNGGGRTKFLTMQTDFVNPITDKIKIEMGVRANFRDFKSFNDNFFFSPAQATFVLNPGISTRYEFTDRIYAGYVTFAQQVKTFSYQLGLRVESSDYEGLLVTRNQKFQNEYPFSFFPSVFLSQKIDDKQDLQLNYSRKINRPNFFQLIPFVDYADSLNISRGNPNLVPEFTNLVELSYQVNFRKGHNILATAYYRNTDDLITRVQTKEPNPDLNRNDSVILTTFANANNASAYGLEITGRNKLAAWWDITTNVNLFNSKLNSSNVQTGLNSERFSYFAKLNNSFRLPKSFSVQLSADYQSKTLLPPSSSGGGQRGGMMGGGPFGGGQLSTANGYIKPNYGVDIAIRKEFMKNNAASISLSVNDIFRTKMYSTFAESIYFVQNTDRRRDPQVVRLNFNYRFGKFDAALFKRKNQKGESEGMQGMQGL